MAEDFAIQPTAETPSAFLIRVNNDVARHLIAAGHLKAAFYHLQDAIRLVSSTLSYSTGASVEKDDGDSMEASLLCNSSVQLQGIPSPGCDPFGIIPNTGMFGFCFLIHDAGSTFQHFDQQGMLQRASAVAIFNMALVCHLQFLQGEHVPSRTRESLCTRTRFLYNQVYELCEDESSPLYLSLCQNCIAISLDFGYVQDANLWTDRLSDAIEKHFGACPLPCVLYRSATFAASQAA